MSRDEPAKTLIVRRLFLILITLTIACKPAQQAAKRPAGAGPTVRATVVTIRTVMKPEDRTIDHSLVIVGDRVRDTSERDNWRLYDAKSRTITTVDDLDRTVRSESFDAISKRRSTALAATVAPFYPQPALKRGGTRTLQGVTAERWLMTSGSYKRELWIGEHPAIPAGVFAMMQASERISSPLAPIMREIDAALVAVRGFPLAERVEFPTGNASAVVEHNVVSIAQRDVPQAWITVPKGYRDLTPPKK
jgi:hypothetical protein